MFLGLIEKSADQTAQMRRLVCTFVVHMQPRQAFVCPGPIYILTVHNIEICLPLKENNIYLFMLSCIIMFSDVIKYIAEAFVPYTHKIYCYMTPIKDLL